MALNMHARTLCAREVLELSDSFLVVDEAVRVDIALLGPRDVQLFDSAAGGLVPEEIVVQKLVKVDVLPDGAVRLGVVEVVEVPDVRELIVSDVKRLRTLVRVEFRETLGCLAELECGEALCLLLVTRDGLGGVDGSRRGIGAGEVRGG